MKPPLSQRLSPRRFLGAATRVGEDPSTLARAHVYFFLAGATLALGSLLLPHGEEVSEAGIAICAALAYGVAVFTLVGFDRLAPWVFRAIQVAGVLLISTMILASGSGSSGYVLFYVWVSLYAGHLFSRAWALGQVVLIGLVYGAALFALDEPGATAQWLLVVGTVAIVAAVVAALRFRLEGLVRTLAEAARTDLLTGLPNRRGFEAVLALELERSERSGEPLGLLLADLDHLKEANDRFGHAHGDHVLQCAARVLEESKRRIDTAARWGGDEFALVVPGGDIQAAEALGERVRHEMTRAFAEERVAITVSFGIASSPLHGRTSAEVLNAADRALYAAKAEGGDRAVAAPTGSGARHRPGDRVRRQRVRRAS